MTEDEMGAWVRDSLVARLATLSPRRVPLITPIWFVNDGPNLLMTTGGRGLAVRNIGVHPRVVLLCDAELAGHSRTSFASSAKRRSKPLYCGRGCWRASPASTTSGPRRCGSNWRTPVAGPCAAATTRNNPTRVSSACVHASGRSSPRNTLAARVACGDPAGRGIPGCHGTPAFHLAPRSVRDLGRTYRRTPGGPMDFAKTALVLALVLLLAGCEVRERRLSARMPEVDLFRLQPTWELEPRIVRDTGRVAHGALATRLPRCAPQVICWAFERIDRRSIM